MMNKFIKKNKRSFKQTFFFPFKDSQSSPKNTAQKLIIRFFSVSEKKNTTALKGYTNWLRLV